MRAELLEQRLMAAADAQALQARVDELQGQQQPLRAGEPTDADGASLPPGSAADGVVTRNTDGAALPSAAAAAEVKSLFLPYISPISPLYLPYICRGGRRGGEPAPCPLPPPVPYPYPHP